MIPEFPYQRASRVIFLPTALTKSLYIGQNLDFRVFLRSISLRTGPARKGVAESEENLVHHLKLKGNNDYTLECQFVKQKIRKKLFSPIEL